MRESSRRLATRPKSWALRSARRLLPLPVPSLSSRSSSAKHKASSAAQSQTQPAAAAVAMTDALAELRHMTAIGAANGGAHAASAGLVSVFAGRSLTSIDMIINEMSACWVGFAFVVRLFFTNGMIRDILMFSDRLFCFCWF